MIRDALGRSVVLPPGTRPLPEGLAPRSTFAVVHPRARGALIDAVVLDRVDDVAQDATGYCVHGRAVCTGRCGHWVWLGDHTHELVSSGAAAPLCRPCADRLLPAGARPVGNAADRRRAGGPH